MTTPTQAALRATINTPLQIKPLTLAESIHYGVVTERTRLISKAVQYAASLAALFAYGISQGAIYAMITDESVKPQVAVCVILSALVMAGFAAYVAYIAYGWRRANAS